MLKKFPSKIADSLAWLKLKSQTKKPGSWKTRQKKLQQCRAQQKHEKQLTQEDCKGKMGQWWPNILQL